MSHVVGLLPRASLKAVSRLIPVLIILATIIDSGGTVWIATNVTAEANDTPDGATTLALNSTATDEITATDTVDWWKIYVPYSYGTLKVEMDIDDSSADLDLKLYASDGSTELDSSTGTTTHEECEIAISTPDWYYAKVYRYAGESTYTISNTFSGEANQPPVAIIDSPYDGETFYTNYDTASILFDASSSYDPDGDTLTYYWYKGLFSILPFATGVTVTASIELGDHIIRLEVYDSTDYDSAMIQIHVVYNQPPVAIINSPPDISYFDVGETITFDASGSYDPEGTALAYTWTSSIDGILGAEPTITTTLSEGTHTVTLEVVDSHGATASASVTVIVQVPNNPPTITVLTPPIEGVTVDYEFIIEWEATDPDPDDTLYIDLYYDSDKNPSGKNLIAFGKPNMGYYIWNTTYIAEGSYYICIQVRDTHGASAYAYSPGQLTIDHNEPPTAPSNIQPDSTHELMPTLTWEPSIDPDLGDAVTYHLNIGTAPGGANDIVSDAVTETTNFKLPVKLSYGEGINTYYIELYAVDTRGLESPHVYDTLDVVNHPPTKCEIMLRPTEPYTNDVLECVIITESDDPDGDEISYTYQWYRKPENELEFRYLPELDGMTQVRSEYTQRLDIWRVVVTPFDSFHFEGEASVAEVQILNSAPVAIITKPVNNYKSTSVTVEFDATASYDPDTGDKLTFYWQSNIDGWIGSEPTFSCELSPGNHKITLQVSDGLITSATEIIVRVEPPIIELVDFRLDADRLIVNTTVNISFELINSGGSKSSKLTLELELDSETLYDVEIPALDPEASFRVKYEWHTPKVAGSYTLRIKLNGNEIKSISFKVEEPIPEALPTSEYPLKKEREVEGRKPSEQPSWSIIPIVIALIVVILVAVLLAIYIIRGGTIPYLSPARIKPKEIIKPPPYYYPQQQQQQQPPLPPFVGELRQLLARTTTATRPLQSPPPLLLPPSAEKEKEKREKAEAEEIEIRCHVCNEIIPVTTAVEKQRPTIVVCPHCGEPGEIPPA